MSHKRQDTQHERLMGSTGGWTKTSTADATRQRKSEIKPLPPLAEESKGRTKRNPSMEFISASTEKPQEKEAWTRQRTPPALEASSLQHEKDSGMRERAGDGGQLLRPHARTSRRALSPKVVAL